MQEQNPYASPQGLTPLPAEQVSEWYVSDLYACNVAEIRRFVPATFTFLLILLFRPFVRLGLLPVRPFFAFSPGHYRPIEGNQLPAEVLDKMRPLAEEAQSLGFRFISLVEVPCVGNIQMFAAAYLSADGLTILRLIYSKLWTNATVVEVSQFAMMSELINGRYLSSSPRPKDVETHPSFDVEYLPGLTMSDLYSRHKARLTSAAASLIFFHDPDELVNRLRQLDLETTKFHLDRGFYKPISVGELERLSHLKSAKSGPDKIPLLGLEVVMWLFVGLTLITWFQAPPPNNGFFVSAIQLGVPLIFIALIYVVRFTRQR